MVPTQHTWIDDPSPSAPATSFAELPLSAWPVGERPVERLTTCGAGALADAELLAVLLHGSGGRNPVALAQQLLLTFAGWHGLMQATLDDLQTIPQLGRTRAAQIKAALEVARRLALAPTGARLQIRSPTDAAQMLMIEMAHLDQEELRTVCLDTKHQVRKVVTVYRGSLNATLVRVGEVFKEALKINAAAIIMAHQHPSGNRAPRSAR